MLSAVSYRPSPPTTVFQGETLIPVLLLPGTPKRAASYVWDGLSHASACENSGLMTAPITTEATAKVLEEKIRTRRARVGIVGLGYVGLPLAVEYAKAGFSVTGIDITSHKVDSVNAGESYVGDIPSDVLGPLVQSGKLRATT